MCQPEKAVSSPTIDIEAIDNEAETQAVLDTTAPAPYLAGMVGQLERVYEQFGREVRRRRTALGWSQARLGEALRPSLTRASIANIEAGQQRVLLHTALDLAASLDVGLPSLLGSAEPTTTPGQDSAALAVELASKLPISPDQARSLASKVSRKKRSEKP
jgi:transcriptional regulator with XRE-family HTH domain